MISLRFQRQLGIELLNTGMNLKILLHSIFYTVTSCGGVLNSTKRPYGEMLCEAQRKYMDDKFYNLVQRRFGMDLQTVTKLIMASLYEASAKSRVAQSLQIEDKRDSNKGTVPNGWTDLRTYGVDSAIFFGNKEMKQAEAVEFCTGLELGATLYTMTSEKKKDALHKEIDRQGITWTIWLGLEKEDNNDLNSWRWVSGETSVMFWYPGEPNNRRGDQHCAQTFEEFDWMVDDVSCDYLARPLCEIAL